jgi:hypothetical protein
MAVDVAQLALEVKGDQPAHAAGHHRRDRAASMAKGGYRYRGHDQAGRRRRHREGRPCFQSAKDGDRLGNDADRALDAWYLSELGH